MLHIVLNQAYHSQWRSADCVLARGGRGNLIANCPMRQLQARPADLVFFDPLSELGSRVSRQTAAAVGVAVLLLGAVNLAPKRRAAPAPSAFQ